MERPGSEGPRILREVRVRQIEYVSTGIPWWAEEMVTAIPVSAQLPDPRAVLFGRVVDMLGPKPIYGYEVLVP